MKFVLGFVLIFMLPSANGKSASQQIAFPPPRIQTVPANYLDAMYRQEQRLDDINGKLIAMETSLKDFKDESQRTLTKIDEKLNDFTATNVVMKFVLAIVILLIPTVSGVWLNEYWRRKRATA